MCVRFLERRKRINATTFINGADAAAAHYFWAASFNMCVVWIGTAFMLFCATMVGSLLKGRRYGCTKGSVCVCAQKYYIFPPPPFFFGSCTTFGFQKLQHCCCYLLHIFWHTGILDGMVVGFYGLEGAQWYTIMVTFHRGSHWNIHLTLWMGNVGWMILEKTFGNYSGIKLPQN